MKLEILRSGSFRIATSIAVCWHDSVFLCFCLTLLFEGAQSDSEISYHPNEAILDRGYTSDSEVYADHSKQGKMHRSVTDVDVVNSGWLVVSKTEGFLLLVWLF